MIVKMITDFNLEYYLLLLLRQHLN